MAMTTTVLTASMYNQYASRNRNTVGMARTRWNVDTSWPRPRVQAWPLAAAAPNARSRTLPAPVHLDADIQSAFLSLFEEHRNKKRKIRLLGTALSNLTHGGEQLNLLDAARRDARPKKAKPTPDDQA